MSPGVVVATFLILMLAELSYAFWPHRRRSFIPILVVTVIGVLVGQVWGFLQLPGLRFGEVNLVPAVIFAAALQPIAARLPIRWP